MKYIFLVVLISVLCTGYIHKEVVKEAAETKAVIYPKVYDKAFPNPLKGFRAGAIGKEDYPTLVRYYVEWNKIENSESDGVDKIKAFSNKAWKGIEERNLKVIPRVYLEWPYGKQNASNTRDTAISDWGEKRCVERFWPDDMKRGDYSSSVFKKRVVKLIEKMGAAWDNDPRVAYLEMGLMGWWGEQHSPSATAEMQKILGDAFKANFKNKLIMIRNTKDFQQYPFGNYWDSFAHFDQEQEAISIFKQGDQWETAVRGGETAYDWGNCARQPGKNPDESLKLKVHRDYIIERVRKLHYNHLGWINLYNPKDTAVAIGASELQKALGYRFILNEVSYSTHVAPDKALEVDFKVTNVGSSPFYYNWPVEVSLLSPETRKPVWKAVFKNIDMRTWLPGDQWDTALGKYTIAPEEMKVHGSFTVPGSIAKGEYILALAILDPAGDVPSVRFAVRNYFNGGRHPVGNIGVEMQPVECNLKDSIFDDIYRDRSLTY